jgi:hypothetical protein
MGKARSAGRWVRDGLLALSLAGLCVGAASLRQQRTDQELVMNQTADSVHRLSREIARRAAASIGETNAGGWPTRVDPAWFGDDPPLNSLAEWSFEMGGADIGLRHAMGWIGGAEASRERAEVVWLEIAGPSEAELEHPPIRIITGPEVASLWYNPARGVVRARVPVMVSDEQTLATYNRVNGAALRNIFSPERDGQRAFESDENVDNFFAEADPAKLTAAGSTRELEARASAEVEEAERSASESGRSSREPNVVIVSRDGTKPPAGLERWKHPPRVQITRGDGQ